MRTSFPHRHEAFGRIAFVFFVVVLLVGLGRSASAQNTFLLEDNNAGKEKMNDAKKMLKASRGLAVRQSAHFVDPASPRGKRETTRPGVAEIVQEGARRGGKGMF